MTKNLAIGFDEALKLTSQWISPLGSETVDLLESVDRFAAEEYFAKIDSPSVDASLKDGFAVLSSDVACAAPDNPVRLKLIGSQAAGGRRNLSVCPGNTVEVLTGAKIPNGADAVVSGEFASKDDEYILVTNNAEPGRNILPKGSDVSAGKSIVKAGQPLTPGRVGILAASGHSRLSAIRTPSVAIVATGDEIVAPGLPLPEGKLYASNITTIAAWCRRYGMRVQTDVVKDDPDELFNLLKSTAEKVDAIITSGGAWTSDRDMVAYILDQLSWNKIFHRIRIGPGKAVGFGLLSEKPVFVLPGGPPSNLMGFLQIAMPGLMQLSGHPRPGLPVANARLASDLRGLHDDWTQFVFGTIENHPDLPVFYSLRNESRLRSMAEADAVAAIPEGETFIPEGSIVKVQLLGQPNNLSGGYQ
ncbi:MAG: molybdopterin molybdotransferase MoeA [Desulfobacteraceae bacterium]|nr:molybdopterin molybdotransferase MoeA [Desulfobacteraceae bacterium]